MSVEAIEDALERYSDELANRSADEFKPTNVVSIPGLSDERAKSLAPGKFNEIRDKLSARLREQYMLALRNSRNRDDVLGDFIGADPYYEKYKGDRDQEFRDELAEWLDELTDTLSELHASNKDDLESMVLDSYDSKTDAARGFSAFFSHASKVEGFSEGIELTLSVPLSDKEVRYTDESIRSYREAEESMKQETEEWLDEVFS